jgi:2-dehydropantoate 2-reductase
MKYLKLFVNANHCIPAVLGLSIQETFSDQAICRLGIGVWREGLEVVSRLGITLSTLPGFPVDNFWKLTTLPLSESAAIFSRISTGFSSTPLYGSILQSIMRGRPTEIDYINGFIVELAEQNSLQAPLNKRLVAMVHEVERSGRFYPKDALIRQVQGMISA